MDKTITIGARYLREGIKRDYNNWRFAWAREVAQNSIDAGATTIMCLIDTDDNGNTVISWFDNGCGMSADTIENKFMALGESGKENGVGGFGVAGALIAFAQLEYTIKTQDCIARGKGSSYGITTGNPYVEGTSLTVIMEGDETQAMKAQIEYWCRFSTTKTNFYLNGRLLPTLRGNKAKAETDWCKVYTHRNIPEYGPRIHIRMNKQLMHSLYTSFNCHIVVDLEGKSLDFLTSNRDGLGWQYREKLNKLIQELYEDPNKIKPADDTTTVWRGTKGLVNLGSERKVSKIGLSTPVLSRPRTNIAALALVSAPTQVRPLFEARTIAEIKTLIDGHDVVIVNQTNQPIPKKWIPGYMNKHAYRLLNRWIRVVQICGQILDRAEEVSVGWIFSHEALAAHKYTQEHGHMILLNPVKLGETKFTNYWDNSSAKFYDMVASAIHEICHIDHGSHNTDFASAITTALGKVMCRPTLLKNVKTQTKV